MRPINEEEKDMILKYRNRSNISSLVLSIVFIVVGFFMRYHSYSYFTSSYLKSALLLIIGIIMFVHSLITLLFSNTTVNKMEVETVQILDFANIDKKKLVAKIIMQTSKGPKEKTVEIVSGEETFLTQTHYGNLYYVNDKPYYIMRTGNQYFY